MLGGCLDAPHLYAHTFICLQGCTCPPHMPPYSSVPLFWGALHVVGSCNGLPFVLGHPPYITPVLGCLPLITPLTLSHWFPVHWYVSRDISMLCGHFPSVEVFGGVSPISWGVGASALEMSICSFLYLFLVHYVSHFDYGSDYYCSYSGIFWPVFHVISDSGSFPDRVSSKLGSAWHSSTTTLNAERLWWCSWLSFCATAATSIFNVSFSLCQLCYGFSKGRFLFQS